MQTWSTPEVTALFDLDEGRVRKDVEYGVFEDMHTPPRFALAEVVYLYTTAGLGFTLGVADRKRLYRLIASALSDESPRDVNLSAHVIVRLEAALRDVSLRLHDFANWKRKLVTRDDILAGETVFPNSRLAVRHIGTMALRGAPVDEILEDYPYLDARDVEFAMRYTKAYPKVGRRPHVVPL